MPTADWEGRRFARTPATAPGPLGPQMLRAFTAIRANPLTYLEAVWRQYGDVVQFPIPRPPSYLVNEPEAVRRIAAPVSPSLEMTEIADRVLRAQGSALLFERPQQADRQWSMPVLANLFGTPHRVALGMGESSTEALREALEDRVPVVFGTLIVVTIPVIVALAVFQPF